MFIACCWLLFVVRCLLFVVCGFVVCVSLCVACWLFVVVRHLLFVVGRCSLYVACCLCVCVFVCWFIRVLFLVCLCFVVVG